MIEKTNVNIHEASTQVSEDVFSAISKFFRSVLVKEHAHLEFITATTKIIFSDCGEYLSQGTHAKLSADGQYIFCEYNDINRIAGTWHPVNRNSYVI
jgi:hypothetical protein